METTSDQKPDPTTAVETDTAAEATSTATSEQNPDQHTEHGGPKGPEPTRYGDWEQKGRCTDF